MTRLTTKDLARAKANGGKFVQPERRELHSFIRWVKLSHPKILYFFDYGADALLTPRQAKERKDLSSGDKWPDIFFPEPSGEFYGLYIELKREDVNIYNTKGLFASDHLRAQGEMLDKLRARGYYCTFAKGAAGARLILTQYLNLKA
jgi:hypothetical protein